MITDLQYQNFLNLVADQLEGEWLVIGGSLLALIGTNQRVTSDIDLCPVTELTNEMRINLMNLAQSCGLPIDAINPAADFFVRQIPNWKNSIIILKKGQKGILYRPSIELYFKLKLNRASESDLQDCVTFYNWHLNQKIRFSCESLNEILDLKISQLSSESHLLGHLKQLKQIIN